MREQPQSQVLDGWRGLSICFVLVAHLIPLPGRKAMEVVAGMVNEFVPVSLQVNPLEWNANVSVGILGMVVFFNLSGFLITSYLLRPDAELPEFLIRRFCRIIPLAWLYLAVVLIFSDATARTWVANYLFYANLPPKQLVPLADHFWSLCVEIQFYVGIAMLFYALRHRGLLLLPVLCLAFTALRVYNGVFSSSVTYYRIDEILAGCTLALAYHGHLGRPGSWMVLAMKRAPQWILIVLLLLSCLSQGGWLNYLRPYLAAFLIGATLVNREGSLRTRLQGRALAYLAGISYALYVLHVGLTGTWLGSGDLAEKYLKRPLLLLALFALAHVSTYHYEQRWIAFGRRLSGLVAGRIAFVRHPSAPVPGSDGRFAWIQALRGIAAALVVSVHYVASQGDRVAGVGQWLHEVGSSGVDIFFVISGFIMTIGQLGPARKDSASGFMARRLLRIAPLYWALTIAAFMLATFADTAVHASYSPAMFASSMLFLPYADHYLLMSSSAFKAYVLPMAWTLTFEWYFYVFFGLTLALGMSPLARLKLLGFCFSVAFALGVAFPPSSLLLQVISSPLVFEFLAGGVIAHLYAGGLRLTGGQAAAAIASGLSLLAFVNPAGVVERSIVWGGAAFLLVAAATLAAAEKQVRPWRALVGLGDISYALYLSHLFSLALFVRIQARVEAIGGGFEVAAVVTFILVTLTMAVLCHRFVEEPARLYFSGKVVRPVVK